MKAEGVIEHISEMEEIALPDKPIHYKRELLLHVDGEFPKKLLVRFWGAGACRHIGKHNVGDKVSVLTNVESKYSKDNWNTTITGYYIKSIS
jgi:hypothetical protein